MNFSNLNFRQANINEADQLTELCLRSKAYWKYSPEFLEKCRPFLTITNEYIEKWPVIVGSQDGKIIGFYSLKTISNENRLDNLWIDIPYIGQGPGKQFLMDAIGRAKNMDWEKMYLASEPGAVDFYIKHGGRVIGQVQSRLEPNLFLPHIEFHIPLIIQHSFSNFKKVITQ